MVLCGPSAFLGYPMGRCLHARAPSLHHHRPTTIALCALPPPPPPQVGGGTRAFEAEAARQGLSCTVVAVLEDRGSNIREICVVGHAAPSPDLDVTRDTAMA